MTSKQPPSGLPGLSLSHLFTLQCAVGTPMEVGDGGLGSSRRVIPITGGTFKGKISGEVLNLGFDAILMSADMTARPDAKYCLKTNEGEIILVESQGFRYPPGMKPGLKGEEARAVASKIPISSFTFILRLKLETGSPRLDYLNKSIIVASAKRTDDAVAYDAYIVEQIKPDDGPSRPSKL